MHAGPFSVNRRRRAQNGTGVAAFGGVGREISKIHIPISHDNKLSNFASTSSVMILIYDLLFLFLWFMRMCKIVNTC